MDYFRSILSALFLAASITIPGCTFSKRLEEAILYSLLLNALLLPIAYFFPIAGYAQIALIAVGLRRCRLEIDRELLLLASLAAFLTLIRDRDYVQFYLRYAIVVALTGKYPFYFPLPRKAPFVVSGPLEVFLIGSTMRLFGLDIYAARGLNLTISIGILALSKRLHSYSSTVLVPGLLVSLAFTAGLLDPMFSFLLALALKSLYEEDRKVFRISLALLPLSKIRRVAAYALFLGYFIISKLPRLRLLVPIASFVIAIALGAFLISAIIATSLVFLCLYKSREYVEIRVNRYALLLALPLIHLTRVALLSGTPLGEYYYLLFPDEAYREYVYRYIERPPIFALMKRLNLIAYLRYAPLYFSPSAPLVFYYALKKSSRIDLFIGLSFALLAIPMPRNPRHFLRLRILVALFSKESKASRAASIYITGLSLALYFGEPTMIFLAILTLLSLVSPELKLPKASTLLAALFLFVAFLSMKPPEGRIAILYEPIDLSGYGITGLLYDGAPGLEYRTKFSFPAVPLFQPILYKDLRKLMHEYSYEAFYYLKRYKMNAFLFPSPSFVRRTTIKVRYLHDFLRIPYFRLLLGPSYERISLGKYVLFLQKNLTKGFQCLIVKLIDDEEIVGGIYDYRGLLVASSSLASMSAGKRIEIEAIFLGDYNAEFYIEGSLIEAEKKTIGAFTIYTFSLPIGEREHIAIDYGERIEFYGLGMSVSQDVAYVRLKN